MSGRHAATPDRATAHATRRAATDRWASGGFPEPEPAGDAMPRPEPMVRVSGVTKTYGTGTTAVHALHDVSLSAEVGTLLAVKGRSGSGKTTLLNCIGGLDQPDAGSIVVAGHEMTTLDEPGLLALRREVIGFVFQSFGLIPILSAAENVGVPMRLVRTHPGIRDDRVAALLQLVGLSEQAQQRPYELSGGQQQRVAIARALANSPKLLLADEPTGQLDSQTGLAIMELLQALVRSQGVTAIVATHDPILLAFADRVVELRDGVLVPED